MSEFIDDQREGIQGLYDELGDLVSYQPAAALAQPFMLTVIWVEGARARARNAAAATIAWVRVSDFSTPPAKGDEITKGGKVYQVAENPKDGYDGAGGVTLILRYMRDNP